MEMDRKRREEDDIRNRKQSTEKEEAGRTTRGTRAARKQDMAL